YVKLFQYEDIELVFDNEVYDFIVEKAWEFKLGARGLRSICEAIMLDAMFELPTAEEKSSEKVLHITLDYAKQKFAKSDIKKLHVAYPVEKQIKKINFVTVIARRKNSLSRESDQKRSGHKTADCRITTLLAM